jgi:hypothetical protein
MSIAHEPPDTTPPPPPDGAEDCGAGAAGVEGAGDGLCGGLGADCVCVCGELGTDCGGDEGPWRPSEPGLAGGGSCGIAVDWDLALEPEDDPGADDPLAAAALPDGVFEASDRPGATAETSPAMPAVSAAVPAITHRRVRPTRAMAASRASAAGDCLLVLIRYSRPIMTDS